MFLKDYLTHLGIAATLLVLAGCKLELPNQSTPQKSGVTTSTGEVGRNVRGSALEPPVLPTNAAAFETVATSPGLRVASSSLLGGGISSIQVDGAEVLASFPELGKSVGGLFSAFADPYGGCYHVNEGGSSLDGLGLTRSTTSIYNWISTGNEIRTEIRMAMWRPASACGVDRSSFYSDFYMAKQVSLNPVVDGESFPKVIEFKSSLHIGEVHQRVFFEAPALYGKKTLSVAYEVDPESGQIYRRGVCSTTQAGCQTGSSRPVIFATPDGSLAMAQFAPDLPADAQKYTAEIVLSPTRHDLPQSKLATIYSYGAPTVGDYSTRTFAAFGTLAEVTGSVVRLARHFSKTGKPAGISESDIRSQYQFFFGRAPTDVELNGWLQVAANTTLTQLINALKCAEETYAYLYQSVLGRGIEPDVLQMRVNQCRSGEKDYADQAREIRCATERFDQEYVRVLDRHIDEGAAANATNLCLNNQLTVLNLRASLVISDEATSLISRVVGLRFGEGVALAQLVNAIRSALLQTNGVSIAGIADQLTITQNIWRETFELTRLETNEATANALADAIAYYSQGGTYALYRQLLTMSSAIRYGFLLQAVRAVSMSVFNTISQNTDHVERVLTWVGLHSLREYKDLLYYAKGIWVNRLGLTTVNNSNYDKIENAVDAMMFDQTPEQYCAVTVQNPEVRRLYAIPAIRQVWRSVLGFVPQSDATMNRSVTALCEGKDLAEQTLILQSINREWRTVCGRSPSETGRPDAVLWYDAAVPAVLDGSITWAQYRKAIAPSCYWVR